MAAQRFHEEVRISRTYHEVGFQTKGSEKNAIQRERRTSCQSSHKLSTT